MKTIEEIRHEMQAALDAARQTHEYRSEGASIEFTEKMLERMQERNMTRSDLARAIDVKPAYVTKILRGETNFTLDTMVKIAHALGCEFRCHLQPEGASTHWVDVLSKKVSESFHAEAPATDAIIHGHFRKIDLEKLQEDSRAKVAA